jgi:glyoxylase-like metal-dependent hydrolase (beta-lactamase superfamily II)
MGDCPRVRTADELDTNRTPEVDPLAEDQAALETSRQRILATADRVVPGHGEPFEAGRSS